MYHPPHGREWTAVPTPVPTPVPSWHMHHYTQIHHAQPPPHYSPPPHPHHHHHHHHPSLPLPSRYYVPVGRNAHVSPTPSSYDMNVPSPRTGNTPIERLHRSDEKPVIMAKPPRPYTEYTMFYQMEREYILHRVLSTEDEAAANNADKVALFINDPLMPERYRNLPLRADWYISGKSKKPTKRKHRKSHGKIGFLELTRMIAARWAKVDDETRKYCRMMAAMELVKYKEDMNAYNQYKDELSERGEVPEDVKAKANKKRKVAAKEKKAKEMAVKSEETYDAKLKMGKERCTSEKMHKLRIEIKQDPEKESMMEPVGLMNTSARSDLVEGQFDNYIEQFLTNDEPQADSKRVKSLTPSRREQRYSDDDMDVLWSKLASAKEAKARPSQEFGPKNKNPALVTNSPIRRNKRKADSEEDRNTNTHPETPTGHGRNTLDIDPIFFDGINANDIARELEHDDNHRISPSTQELPEEDFGPIDYWEALVESPNH